MATESSLCLACLTKVDLFSIFDTHDCDGLGEIDPAANMLRNCFGIEITPGTDLNTICGTCMLKLREAYQFKVEIAKNTTEIKCQVHLQLEYLEDLHSDIEVPDKSDYLQNYNIESELDPETGCLRYVVNDNIENDKDFDKNAKDNIISVKTYKNKRSKRTVALSSSLQKDNREKIFLNVQEGVVFDHLQTVKTHETEVQIKSYVFTNSSNNVETPSKPILTHKTQTSVNKEICDEKNTIVTKDTNNLFTKKSVKFMDDKTKESNKKHFTLEPGQTECSICKEIFHTTKKLHEHMHMHYPHHACAQCGKKFACQKTLKRHVATHLDGPFPCTKCDKIFTKLNTRSAHIWRVHQTANPYLCSQCGDRFRTFHQRLRHQQEAHGQTEPRYPCPHCNNKYFYAGSRSQHIRVAHLRERRCACPQCPMAFARRRDARAHLAAAHGVGDKRHRCPRCQKSFYRSTTLKYHLKTHEKAEKKLHHCTVCDARFSYKAVLKCHMKCHEVGNSTSSVVDDTVVVEDKIIEGSNDTVYLEYLDMK